MVLRIGVTAWSVLALLALSGCGTRELSVNADDAYPPVFSAIRQRILQPRCGTCHSKIVLYQEVLTLVQPGVPEGSQLFEEIDSGDMPKYGGKITDEEIASIAAWIKKGAPND